MEKIQTLPMGTVLHGKKEYVINNVLGFGGCGILYRATSTVMDGNIEQTHQYAIKEYFDKNCCFRTISGYIEITCNCQDQKELRDEFRSEAEGLRKLRRHNNIVQVNEVFEENGTFYYVMEYLTGSTLRDYITNKLNEADAIAIVKDIAKALDYLHSEGINHLDVKPDNIMVVNDKNKIRCVLIDFGLSKHFNKNGKLKGKQGCDGASDGYSPKEQYDGIDFFSPQSDVYALAATLFFLLTGHDPCNGKYMSNKYLAKSLPDNIKDATFDALTHALCSDKALRTKSVSAFYNDLTGQELNSTKESVVTEIFRKKKQPRSNNENKLLKISLSVTILVFGICCFLYYMNKENTKTDNCSIKETQVLNSKQSVDKMTHSANIVNHKVYDETTNCNEGQEVNKLGNANHNNEKKGKEDKPLDSSARTSIPSGEKTPDKGNSYNQIKSPNKTEKTSRKNSHGTLDIGYAIWNGGIKNGKPDGVGKMKFKRTHKLDSETSANVGDVFDGTFTNGHIDDGKLYRSNGEIITIIGEN